MALEINAIGEIGRASGPERPGSSGGAATSPSRCCWRCRSWWRRSRRGRAPHSVVNLNAQIGQQRVAFGVFTLFVVVGSIVTGFSCWWRIERFAARSGNWPRRSAGSCNRSGWPRSVPSRRDGPRDQQPGGRVGRALRLPVERDPRQAVGPRDPEDLETIQRQSQRIAKTVHDMLTSTARPARGGPGCRRSSIVDQLVRPVGHDPASPSSLASRPAPARLGRPRSARAGLVNLLSNAAHAIAGAAVDVTATMSWRSDGSTSRSPTPGRVSPEHMAASSIGSSRRRSRIGSGLGLSIVAASSATMADTSTSRARSAGAPAFVSRCGPASGAEPPPDAGSAAGARCAAVRRNRQDG